MANNRKPLFRAALIVLLCAGMASAQELPEGTVLWDLGFRPAQDGFSFENYGNDAVSFNLTPEEMQGIFGDVVCADMQDGKCILTPPAEAWMEQINESMDGGHCDGMATLAPLFFVKYRDPAAFGADGTFGLQLPQNDALAREIARWWATQATSPTTDEDIKDKTPDQIVEILIESGQTPDELETLYAVGIYMPDGSGGHSISPYAVVDKGNNIAWIMIYDNNYPGEAKHIEVDRAENTWRYSTATRPDEAVNDYTGDATTFNLTLTPSSARAEEQVANFEGEEEEEGEESRGGMRGSTARVPRVRYNQVFLEGDGNLLITDTAGRRMGFAEGIFYREIPGAKAIFIRGVDYERMDVEPIYNIPVGLPFTITLDGATITTTEPSDIVMIGPGYNLAVEGISLTADQKDHITFSPNGNRITYEAGGDENPTIVLGRVGKIADYEFEIGSADLEYGAKIDVQLDFEKNRLRIETIDAKESATLILAVTRIAEDGEAIFENDDILVEPGEVGWLEYGGWNGVTGGMTFNIDKNHDGKIDRTVPLRDEK